MRIPATSRRNPRRPDKILTEPAEKYREILAKCGPGGSPEPPESVRERARAKKMQKINLRTQKVDGRFFFGTVFTEFWDPAGSAKSTKIGSEAEAVGAVGRVLPFFLRFFRRRARKSTFAPIRGPFWDPPTSRKCSKYYGFGTFSRFQKKAEKRDISTWKFLFVWPIGKKKASQNLTGPSGRFFLDPKRASGFSPFFCAPSLPEKVGKKSAVPPLTEGVGGLAAAAGKVRKGNLPFRARQITYSV